MSRLELRPAFAARPVPGLEALLGPRFYVNAGGPDVSLAPVQPLGGLFSSVSERREAERQTSWCAVAQCLHPGDIIVEWGRHGQLQEAVLLQQQPPGVQVFEPDHLAVISRIC